LVFTDLLKSSASMHPDRLADAVRQAAHRMGGRDPVVLVVDLQQQSLMPLGPDPDDLLRRVPVDRSPAGEAFRCRRTVAIDAEDGIRLWLPIRDSADRLGVLGVTVDHGDTSQLIGVLEALASLTGELLVSKAPYGDSIALARRTRQTTLAAELRWAMLPPLTFSSAEVLVSGILEPAYEIAGDTFDYAINGSTVHLAILDAMGHGLEASRMANLAVTSYRHSRRSGLSLHETMEEMDRVIADQFGPSKFVTGQLATLDLDRGVLRMLNLGHPLPMLLRGAEVVGELECSPALPAGLGSMRETVLETQLEPGDLVLLHTDGITEARRTNGEEFGAERFAEVVSSLLAAGEAPEELLRRVVNEVLAFQDFRPRDDATLLVVGWHLPHGRIQADGGD
jgi:hypothetical protein